MYTFFKCTTYVHVWVTVYFLFIIELLLAALWNCPHPTHQTVVLRPQTWSINLLRVQDLRSMCGPGLLLQQIRQQIPGTHMLDSLCVVGDMNYIRIFVLTHYVTIVELGKDRWAK